MQLKLKSLILASFLTMTPVAHADEPLSMATVYGDIFIYRPAGLAMTIAGTAMFVAMSPFLAIANLAPPHDAFDNVSEMIVIAPYNFTFNRPIGALRPDGEGVYHRHYG